MSLDQAIDEALAPRHALTPPPDLLDASALEPLTERQWEVAELVARGLTNRQIGEALVITEGTANLHVKHVLRRLGFATRAQIATWVAQQGRLAVAPIGAARR
jgi:non-specific serine/threonine protein kinase